MAHTHDPATGQESNSTGTPQRLILHWDGSITAGNLITAVTMLVLVVVWGIRLEGRVNMEALARRNLASAVGTAVLNLQQEMKNADDSRQQAEADIKSWLARIDGRLGVLMLKAPGSVSRP